MTTIVSSPGFGFREHKINKAFGFNLKVEDV